MSAYPISDSSSSSGDSAEWVAGINGDQTDEEETLQIISLVDDRVFSDAAAMLTYCKDKTGLDFLGVRDKLGLDFHGSVKLINFSEFLFFW